MAIRLVVRPPGGTADYSLTFDQQRVTIGRGVSADLRLPHPAVSDIHAVIRLGDEGPEYVLVDPASTNGTMLNGARLVHGRSRLLRSGDVIRLAGFEVVFRAGAAMEGAHTAERTAALARRIVREALGVLGEGGSPPRLTLVSGARAGDRFDLRATPSVLVVGRGEGCDVVLEDADASRTHCEVRRESDGVAVRDLSAKNPTLVNGEPVRERALHDRDELVVGRSRLLYEDPAEAYLAALQRIEADADAPGADVAVPATRTGTLVDVALQPEQPDPPPTVPPRPPPSRRGRTGPSLGEWIVIGMGVTVLIGSVVATFYVFR